MFGYERRIAVLVVDHNAPVRRLIAKTLRGMRWAVLEAANATEGITAFRIHSGDIDLAIIDLTMPGGSGVDLAAELDRQQPGLKILYTSASIDSVAMKSIAQHHPEAILPKPFTPSGLVAKVRDLIYGIAIARGFPNDCPKTTPVSSKLGINPSTK